MRLGRLVAAGLVAGALAGFIGALLRPRTVQNFGSKTGDSADPPTGFSEAVQVGVVKSGGSESGGSESGGSESGGSESGVAEHVEVAGTPATPALDLDALAAPEHRLDVDDETRVAASARSRGTVG